MTSIAASGSSYAVWASAGILGSFLMVLGVPLGVTVLVVELRTGRRRAAFWPIVLLCVSLLPLAFILTVGTALGL